LTKKLGKRERLALEKLGQKIRRMILEDRGYASLDAFALEFHDLITKPTLYQICSGKRDMKFSTLYGLARALNLPLARLISGRSLSA